MARNFRGKTSSLQGRNFIFEGHGCSKKQKSCITSLKPLSVHCFPNFEFFPVWSLPHLSNMPTTFSVKVSVLKYKTECEDSPTKMP